MPSDARDSIDVLIDEALSGYSNEKPRRGLEQRILSRSSGNPAAPRYALPPWAWIAGAAAACMAIAGVGLVAAGTVFAGMSLATTLGAWCERLQETWMSTAIRESTLMWVYIEGTHLLGLALMLGPSMMLDLRLVGVLWKSDPVSKVEARFLPITMAGFVLMVTTGGLLFWSEPVRCFYSSYFRTKIILLVLAGLNALVFHSTIDRKLAEWDMVLPTPLRARLAGILGLILWTGVVFAGRYTAYNLYNPR